MDRLRLLTAYTFQALGQVNVWQLLGSTLPLLIMSPSNGQQNFPNPKLSCPLFSAIFLREKPPLKNISNMRIIFAYDPKSSYYFIYFLE